MNEIYSRPNNPEHFGVHHEDGEAIVCLGDRGECKVVVEITPGYSYREEQQLIQSTIFSLSAIDQFVDGRLGDICRGLHIIIGENLCAGGGRSEAEKNQVILNGRKMLLSIREMKEVSQSYDSDNLTTFIHYEQAGGSLEYNIAHEIGHIIDAQTSEGSSYHRVDSSESPTKYGRELDEWHKKSKDHEAFAEGFAHEVFGMPNSIRMKRVVASTLLSRIQEIGQNTSAKLDTSEQSNLRPEI